MCRSTICTAKLFARVQLRNTSPRRAGACKRDKSGTTSKLNTKKTIICTSTSLLLGCARVELRTTTTKPVVDSSSVKNGRGGQSQSLEEGRAGRWLSGSFHTLWMGPTHQGPAPCIFFDNRGTRGFRPWSTRGKWSLVGRQLGQLPCTGMDGP